MKKILWIGHLVNETEVSEFRAISPAANNWQWRTIVFLRGYASVNILSYIPYPLWPKGKFYSTLNVDVSNSLYIRYVSYFNLPWLRELSLTYSLKKGISRFVSENEPIDTVITYNALPRHVKIGEYCQSKGIKWVSIIADDEAVGHPDLTVFLSYDYYRRYQGKKLFFEGLVRNYVDCPIVMDKPIVILYSGSISPWTGIMEFVKVFRTLDKYNIELHIYGKDPHGLAKAMECSHIKYKGFVNEEELIKAYRNAFAFVNPRPLNINMGDNNFPSKLLEYLAFGKPILSTKAKGIPPNYYEFLYLYESNDLISIERVISLICNLSSEELIRMKHKIKCNLKQSNLDVLIKELC
jgi:glycosyltransferase involved in cell wall biosynthesis